MGVPVDLAEYLVAMDWCGHSLVRSPMAMSMVVEDGFEKAIKDDWSLSARHSRVCKPGLMLWRLLLDIWGSCFLLTSSEPLQLTGESSLWLASSTLMCAPLVHALSR